MKTYIIGVDIGTSGAKCILMEPSGRLTASAVYDYPLSTPRPGWAEQDPEDWYRAVCEGIRQVVSGIDPTSLLGIGFSGQMHGLVPLDGDGRVIRPAILWCDQRTQKQCDEITRLAGGEEGLLSCTNNLMLTGYTGGKLLWLREEEPEAFARMKRFVCPKDYIRYRLTGRLATDVSDASGTGFFDTRRRVWCAPLIRLTGLDEGIFPQVLESAQCAGSVTSEAAVLTSLPAGLPCWAGGGDAVIQSVGSGLVSSGVLGVVIGTAGNVSMALDHYTENPEGKLQMFCGNDPDMWTSFGSTLAAGGAYRWWRDQGCADLAETAKRRGENVYEMMNRLAASSRPGSNGVIFTPYLSGERCPYPDADARGCFYGLSLNSTRADMTRAVMEGITYSLAQIIDIYRALSPLSCVISSGGGAASPLWPQMQADIFELPVRTVSAAAEGGAFGAALVGGVGAGVWPDLKHAVSVLKTESECLPNRQTASAYRKSYALYRHIYPALRDVYRFGACPED